jgi:hypothetical protein
LSRGRISNVLGTVLCFKLKHTRLVEGDVEITKRQYLHHNTNASTPKTTTTATIIITATIKAKTTPIITGNTITTGATVTKAKGIKGKTFVKRVTKQYHDNCSHYLSKTFQDKLLRILK